MERRPEAFLNSGETDTKRMKSILGSTGVFVQAGQSILELGCASGRMIRWLADFAEHGEVWGADISAEHIVWCQQHVSPPFNFVTVTTAPHLPFEARYFDLIFCGSVFTHIDDLADAWLLELRRILRPGGRLYITIHDKHSLDLLMNHPETHLPEWFKPLPAAYADKARFDEVDYNMFSTDRGAAS
jgi:ubiquinone/menaquinone biosynthesis C-methylase UbiE